MRPHELGDALDQLGQLVVELLPEFPREKREPLEQALHVRIGTPLGQVRGGSGVRPGELRTHLAEERQLVVVVLVEHAAAIP